jgi:hypothetical protein
MNVLDELDSKVKHELLETTILAYGNRTFLLQNDYSVVCDFIVNKIAEQGYNIHVDKYQLAFGNYRNGYFFELQHNNTRNIKDGSVLNVKYFPFYNRMHIDLCGVELARNQIWINL